MRYFMYQMRKKRAAQKFAPKPALREYREQNDLSCEEAGAKIGVAGTTWRSYENGNREVDGDTAVLIEERCGIERSRIRTDLFQKAAA